MKFAVSSVSGRKREGAVIFDCSIISSETCIRLRLDSRPTPCPSPAPDFQSAGWENSPAGRSISSVWKLRTVLEFVPISYFHPDRVQPEPSCQRNQSSHLCRHPLPAAACRFFLFSSAPIISSPPTTHATLFLSRQYCLIFALCMLIRLLRSSL